MPASLPVFLLVRAEPAGAASLLGPRFVDGWHVPGPGAGQANPGCTVSTKGAVSPPERKVAPWWPGDHMSLSGLGPHGCEEA